MARQEQNVRQVLLLSAHSGDVAWLRDALDRAGRPYPVDRVDSVNELTRRLSERPPPLLVTDLVSDLPPAALLELLLAHPSVPLLVIARDGERPRPVSRRPSAVGGRLMPAGGLDLTAALSGLIPPGRAHGAEPPSAADLLDLYTGSVSEIYTLHGPDGHVRYLSPSCYAVLGYRASDLLEMNPWRLIEPEERALVRRELFGPARDGRPGRATFRMRRASGETIWVEAEMRPVVDDDGRITQLYGVTRDVTERVSYETLMTRQAYHDALTDLPNRLFFMRRLEETMAEQGARPLALLILDLARFKVVNDSLGHYVGDRLLRDVADRLRATLDSRHLLARLGGDEFLVLIPTLDLPGEATTVAEEIAAALQEPFHIDGHDLFLTSAIGIVVSDDPARTPHSLLRDADTAMYRSKQQGVPYARFEPHMNETMRAQLELETALRQAITAREFLVYYQPMVTLDNGRIYAVEALARWQHPRLGIVPPSRFIPAAEETGLILPLGEWVLDVACRQVRRWQIEFPTGAPLQLSVNLSARQFLQPDLPKQVATILKRNDFAPEHLILEITESVVMQEAQTTIEVLRALKALGVQIAIDDFGTGYSSLSYLRRFPVDHLKIDRGFVSNLRAESEDYAIVEAVVALARTLGLAATAEGVESADQLRFLTDIGCKHWQGFYFARPLPDNALTALLRSSQ